MKILFLVCIFFINTAVIIASSPTLHAAENVIVASATVQSRVAAVSELIMERAYARLGYQLKVRYFPGNQALIQSNQGQVDAELVRIEGVDKKYPNLVPISESLFSVKGMAFFSDASIKVASSQDLWGRRIGIVRGIQWAEKLTEDQSPMIVSDVHELFMLLANRRIDIALESQLTGQPELKHFPDSGLVMSIGSVTQFPVFHYINKRQRNLREDLEKIIRGMKKRGEISKILVDYYRHADTDHD